MHCYFENYSSFIMKYYIFFLFPITCVYIRRARRPKWLLLFFFIKKWFTRENRFKVQLSAAVRLPSLTHPPPITLSVCWKFKIVFCVKHVTRKTRRVTCLVIIFTVVTVVMPALRYHNMCANNSCLYVRIYRRISERTNCTIILAKSLK